jgi:hypothetical protein
VYAYAALASFGNLSWVKLEKERTQRKKLDEIKREKEQETQKKPEQQQTQATQARRSAPQRGSNWITGWRDRR